MRTPDFFRAVEVLAELTGMPFTQAAALAKEAMAKKIPIRAFD